MAEVEKDKGIGVDVERFKGHHRKLNLYRIHFSIITG
jgi:hypothetical protein